MGAPGNDPRASGGGRGWKFYTAIAVTALALVLIVQNSQETTVKFLFAETEMPLFFALLVATLLGTLIGWLAPRVRRGSRSRD